MKFSMTGIHEKLERTEQKSQWTLKQIYRIFIVKNKDQKNWNKKIEVTYEKLNIISVHK